MIRETSVHRVEDIGRLVAEHLLGEQARHTVGQVERNLKIGIVAFELGHESHIVVMDVLCEHLSAYCRHRGCLPFVNPGLNLSEACIQTHRKRVFAAHLHSVVLCRIVACSNLD